MTVAHPYPPEQYTPSLAAWREGLASVGVDPSQRSCKLHLRVWVDENADRAREVAQEAISRYDHISTVGRTARLAYAPGEYAWDAMLQAGRNVYGAPDQCIRAIEATRRNYDFDIFSTTFFFGGVSHEAAMKSMRLFAREVMPAFR